MVPWTSKYDREKERAQTVQTGDGHITHTFAYLLAEVLASCRVSTNWRQDTEMASRDAAPGLSSPEPMLCLSLEVGPQSLFLGIR